MHIHLSPRHMPLTEAIHQAVATHLWSARGARGGNHRGARGAGAFRGGGARGDRSPIRVHLAIAGPDIFATASGERSLYIAMELVTGKLARQLRERKTARKDKGRTVTQRALEQERLTGTLPKAIRAGLAAKNGGRASSSGRKRSSSSCTKKKIAYGAFLSAAVGVTVAGIGNLENPGDHVRHLCRHDCGPRRTQFRKHQRGPGPRGPYGRGLRLRRGQCLPLAEHRRFTLVTARQVASSRSPASPPPSPGSSTTGR